MNEKGVLDRAKSEKIPPPVISRNIFTDINYFILTKPRINSYVKFHSLDDRENFSKRILQRTGLWTGNYEMLNIHKIGIEVPASYVFEELMRWNGDSSCWPNHIANVSVMDKNLEMILVYLFKPLRIMKKTIGYRLFNLKIEQINKVPYPYDNDNARYLIYECSGGYPIGIFSIYVRSSIPELGEEGMSQLFFVVAFNFYGSRSISSIKFIRKIWEGLHNRVTANIANRFKQLCEYRFESLVNDNIK